jgi:hypothetical protein
MGGSPSIPMPSIPPPSSWGNDIVGGFNQLGEEMRVDQWGGAITGGLNTVGDALSGAFSPVVRIFQPPPPPPPPPPPWYPDDLPPPVPQPAPPVGLTQNQQDTFTRYLNNYLATLTKNINIEFSNSNTILAKLVIVILQK